METVDKNNQDAGELTKKMLAAASPEGVFGEPIQSGDTTVITASESVAALGIGNIGQVGGGDGTSVGRPNMMTATGLWRQFWT